MILHNFFKLNVMKNFFEEFTAGVATVFFLLFLYMLILIFA